MAENEIVATVTAPIVVETTPVAVTTPEPVQTVTPEIPVIPVQEVPVAPVTQTLLGAEIKPVVEPAPTVDTPVVPEVKTEGGQSVEPAPPPKYEAFVFPDGLKPTDEKVNDFTKFLTKLELDGKADHATVQAVGQDLVNLYVGDVKKAAEGVTNYYQQTWEKQKNDWRDAVVRDPEMGGNRLQTNINAINTFLDTHGGTAEQVSEFRKVMETTGLGNNPALFRLLVNVSNAYKEGTPLAATKPVQQNQSRVKTLYSKSQ